MWQLLPLLVVLLLLILAVSRWKCPPFVTLLLAAMAMGPASGLGGVQTINLLTEGFSNTLISDAVVKLFGERRLSWAMGITGYLVSIPVSVDVADIILQPVT